eukprot:scaffold28003_cov72-Skeletonema_dohrnii-CCMP3373.AAC.1
MQILHVPTKTEDSQPGTTLNPASCASGLALLGGGGGGGEGSDWISALSLTTLIERRMRGDQGNNRRRINEDWDDLHLPQAQGNLFLGDGDN